MSIFFVHSRPWWLLHFQSTKGIGCPHYSFPSCRHRLALAPGQPLPLWLRRSSSVLLFFTIPFCPSLPATLKARLQGRCAGMHIYPSIQLHSPFIPSTHSFVFHLLVPIRLLSSLLLFGSWIAGHSLSLHVTNSFEVRFMEVLYLQALTLSGYSHHTISRLAASQNRSIPFDVVYTRKGRRGCSPCLVNGLVPCRMHTRSRSSLLCGIPSPSQPSQSTSLPMRM